MGWIIGIIAVIVFLWMMIAYPRFRVTVIVIIVLAGLGIWWATENQKKKQRLALDLIKPAEIELTEFRIAGGTASWDVTGKVKNLSPSYTLLSISLEITAYDCPGEEINSQCDIIGEDTVTPSVGAPPGQVRSFDTYAFFSNMPEARNLLWRYELVALKGRAN